MKRLTPLGFFVVLALMIRCGQSDQASFIRIQFTDAKQPDLIIANADYTADEKDNVVRVDLMLFQLADDYLLKMDTLMLIEDEASEEGLTIERFVKGSSTLYFLKGRQKSAAYLAALSDELEKRSRDSKKVVKAIDEVSDRLSSKGVH